MVPFQAMHRLLDLHLPQDVRLPAMDRKKTDHIPDSNRSTSPGRSLEYVHVCMRVRRGRGRDREERQGGRWIVRTGKGWKNSQGHAWEWRLVSVGERTRVGCTASSSEDSEGVVW